METEAALEWAAVFFRCPKCDLISHPSRGAYSATADRLHIDWSRRVRVGCAFCSLESDISQGDVLERDAAAACPRCHDRTPCPREADWVQCDGCFLVFDGPEMSPERLTYRDAIRYATVRKTWVKVMESKLPKG